MCSACDPTMPFQCDAGRDDSPAAAPTRRSLLKSGAAAVAGGAAAPLARARALAQGGAAADPELARLQSAASHRAQGRRRVDPRSPGRRFRPGGPADRGWQDPRDPAEYRAADERRGGRRHEPHHHSGLRRHPQPFTRASSATSCRTGCSIPITTANPDHADAGLRRDDAYAGVLLSALGFIDMGTTAIVDISQCSHTPEHSDAMIRALSETGIRAVYSYHRGAGHAHQYPQDIKRLQKTYFSSKDQLLTLALTTNLSENIYSLARDVGVQVGRSISSARTSTEQVQELAGQADAAGRRIHPLHRNQCGRPGTS